MRYLRAMIAKVQVWVYRRSSQGIELLLLRTVPDRGSAWQPVTGSVNAGESLESAALREATEETGWSFKSASLCALDFEFEFEGRWGKARETAFALELVLDPDRAPTLDPTEHVDWKWTTPKEAAMLLPAFPQQHESLKKFLRALKREGESR